VEAVVAVEAIAGVVIEKVSRRSYYDYVREHIFAPAGMLSTDSQPEEVSVPGRAVGYMQDAPDAGWQPSTKTLPYRGTSAGGGYSTVEDLHRFATALQANLRLDPKHTDLLVTPKPFPGSDHQYGYGFSTEDDAGLRCFGHGGGAPGMNGALSICPKEGYVIVVLANLDPPAASRARDYVSSRLPLGATPIAPIR
jgi:D-alanyl-D-alanine carboxypeptidase